jgi:hypothetical protein
MPDESAASNPGAALFWAMVNWLSGGRLGGDLADKAAGFPYTQLLVAAVFAILVPMIIIAVRENVKARRQGIIRDLERVFTPVDGHPNVERIVPSFEFVKYKYFVRGYAGGSDDPTWSEVNKDLPFWKFLLCSLPFAIVSMFGLLLTFDIIGGVLNITQITGLTFSEYFSVFFTADSPEAPGRPPVRMSEKLADFRNILGAGILLITIAFLCAYLFCIRDFLRRIASFDLSPLSFLRASFHLLLAMVFSVVLWLAMVSAGNEIGGLAVALATAIPIAACCGLFPEFSLRALQRLPRVALMKGANTEVFASAKSVPVEIIDGIDSAIQHRLEEFNIYDVQNLATANPIMLFVETPYGVYQTIDWVVQAQLCCVVGADAFLKLRALNVRTIFDLEWAVLGRQSTRPLRQAVGAALYANAAPEARQHLTRPAAGAQGDAAPREYDDDSIVHSVCIALDDLHVHRLRQIWCAIESKLGVSRFRVVHRSDEAPRPAPDPVSASVETLHRPAAE